MESTLSCFKRSEIVSSLHSETDNPTDTGTDKLRVNKKTITKTNLTGKQMFFLEETSSQAVI